MDPLLLVKAFSVALAAGGLAFLLGEWRFYRKSFRQSRTMLSGSPDTGRLLRRSVGSALLVLMSALIFVGQLPQPGALDPSEAMRLFYYWVAVIGLALALAVVAIVDMISGVRRLGAVMSSDQARELSALAEQLRQAHADPSLLDKLTIEDQDLRPG